MRPMQLQSASKVAADNSFSILYQKQRTLFVSSTAACGGVLFAYYLGEPFQKHNKFTGCFLNCANKRGSILSVM